MLERSVRSSVSNSSNSFSVREEEGIKRLEVACVEAASVEVVIVRPVLYRQPVVVMAAAPHGLMIRIVSLPLFALGGCCMATSSASCLVIFERED